MKSYYERHRHILLSPNQVGTVLLSCAFLYDILWVFVSKWWFHESVMIVVSVLNETPLLFSRMLNFGFINMMSPSPLKLY